MDIFSTTARLYAGGVQSRIHRSSEPITQKWLAHIAAAELDDQATLDFYQAWDTELAKGSVNYADGCNIYIFLEPEPNCVAPARTLLVRISRPFGKTARNAEQFQWNRIREKIHRTSLHFIEGPIWGRMDTLCFSSAKRT